MTVASLVPIKPPPVVFPSTMSAAPQYCTVPLALPISPPAVGAAILWEKALIAFKDNRLFGIGFGAFQTYFSDNYHISGISAYLTHNIYIGLLAETGIVGTVIYLSFMISCLVATVKLRKSVLEQKDPLLRHVYLYALLLQFWFVIYGFSGNGIYDANETFFYFSEIAMMLSLKI